MNPRRAVVRGGFLLAIYWGTGVAWSFFGPLTLFSRAMLVFLGWGVLVAPGLLAISLLAQAWSRVQLQSLTYPRQDEGPPQRTLALVALALVFFDVSIGILAALGLLYWLS